MPGRWLSHVPSLNSDVACRYDRPASGKPASSFSFAGDRGASALHSTPGFPDAEAPDQHSAYTAPDEAEGETVVTCFCGLACNRLEAKTEKNMGRCAV